MAEILSCAAFCAIAEKSAPPLIGAFSKEILSVLLLDRTTNKNVLWATGDYAQYGIEAKSRMELEQVYGSGAKVRLVPRCQKQKEEQASRTRSKAEVFTPSWVCNEMNNLVDESWFGRAGVFNSPSGENPKKWITTTEKIIFDTDTESERTWQDYVNASRLEITCGEAPYLTSRYDTVTGEPIELESRIGLLDRKMRVVRENAVGEADYLAWTERAFQNTYGFEWCGDNVILARANLLLAFVENTQAFLRRPPTEEEQLRIAEIISWNIWQMDGLTFKIPFSPGGDDGQRSLFEEFNEAENFPCKIMDWKEGEVIEFRSLVKRR